MSKFTRLNKTNHYHDRNSTNQKYSLDSGSFLNTTKRTTIMNSINQNISTHFTSPTTASKKLNAIEFKRRAQQNNNNNICSRRLTNYKLYNYSKMGARIHSTNNNKLAFVSIAVILVLLIYINGVHSLNCYHCSSADNPGCDEAFTGRANFTDTDCEKQIGRPAKVCRKIVQYIEHKKVVIRSCGFIDEHEEQDRKPMCYKRSGTFAIMMESCICYDDNCNHSASLVPNQSVLILLVTSCTLFLIFYLTNHEDHYSPPLIIDIGNKR